MRPTRILKNLEQNKIVIVAGFQGVSRHGEITTLGRGGSDTTAVALGVSLNAAMVEFYKDVPGIFPQDPKIDLSASAFKFMSYDEAIDIVKKGAKVLHQRSLLLAKKHQIPLPILSFKEELQAHTGTGIEPEGSRPIKPIFEEETAYSLRS